MRKIEQEGRSPPESEIELDDSLAQYLRDVAQIPLLSALEEKSLARQIREGKEARERLIDQDGNLSSEEKKELQQDVEEGNQANKKFTRSNLRLVISQAKRRRGQGVSFIDLIQEGNMGLIRAVERFDERMGFKFSTYAIHWIHQAVGRAIADQGRAIRVPVNVYDHLKRLKRKRTELSKEIGRELDLEETAELLGWTQAKKERILRVPEVTFSLDFPMGEDENSYLGEFIEDGESPSPVDDATRELLKEQVREVVDSLPRRQAKVLRLRFGLDDNSWERTLEEVGQELGVTRERARQIEAEAFKKLRHPSRSRKLKNYLK